MTGRKPLPASVVRVLRQVNAAFYTLADEAGDVPTWNRGGDAYRASQAVKRLLTEVAHVICDNCGHAAAHTPDCAICECNQYGTTGRCTWGIHPTHEGPCRK